MRQVLVCFASVLLCVAVAPPEAATLRGQILDLNGFPVPEAEVFVGESRGYDAPAGFTARADGRGVYELPGLPAGEATVTVRRAGFAPELVRVDLPGGDKPHALDFELRPPGLYRVRVVDPDGEPIERAVVKVDSWRGADTLPSRFFTGPDGVGEWGGPRDAVQVTVTAEAHRLAEAEIVPTAPDGVVEVTLEPAIPVEVLVLDTRSGEPVPGLRLAEGFLRPGGGFAGEGDAATDADGVARFWFDRLPGSWGFRTRSDRYAEATVPLVDADEDGEPIRLTLEVELIDELELPLRLPDGRPAAGAEVWLPPVGRSLHVEDGRVKEDWYFGEPLLADADGTVRFRPHAIGDGNVIATHEKGVAWASLADPPDELVLEPYARVEVRLTTNGEPAAGQLLSLGTWARGWRDGRSLDVFQGRSTLQTDADGRAVFERVWPGSLYVSRYGEREDGGGLGTGEGVRLEAEHGQTAFVDVAEHGVVVTGRMTGLEEHNPGAMNPPFVTGRLRPEGGEPTSGHGVFVEADGSFRIAAVPAGRYVLTISSVDPMNGRMLQGLRTSFTAPAWEPGSPPIDLGELELSQPERTPGAE